MFDRFKCSGAIRQQMECIDIFATESDIGTVEMERPTVRARVKRQNVFVAECDAVDTAARRRTDVNHGIAIRFIDVDCDRGIFHIYGHQALMVNDLMWVVTGLEWSVVDGDYVIAEADFNQRGARVFDFELGKWQEYSVPLGVHNSVFHASAGNGQVFTTMSKRRSFVL